MCAGLLFNNAQQRLQLARGPKFEWAKPCTARVRLLLVRLAALLSFNPTISLCRQQTASQLQPLQSLFFGTYCELLLPGGWLWLA